MAPLYPRPMGAPAPRRPAAYGRLADAEPHRAPVPLRRYDYLFRNAQGDIEDGYANAPAIPGFEASCGAFAHGTMIQTADGSTPVEDLLPGMPILTRDEGLCPLLWVGSMTLLPQNGDARVAPAQLTRIIEGSVGLGRPNRDLVLGPYARILRRNAACLSLFGTESAFAPAAAFADGVSIIEVHPVSSVRVFHLALEGQHVITANGVEVESFHPGRRDTMGVPPSLLPAFMALFPHVEDLADFGPMRVPRLSQDDIRALESV